MSNLIEKLQSGADLTPTDLAQIIKDYLYFRPGEFSVVDAVSGEGFAELRSAAECVAFSRGYKQAIKDEFTTVRRTFVINQRS